MPYTPCRNVLASTVAVASLLLATGNAQADEALTLDNMVVSASGFEQKITEAPASISVISQQDLQQKRYSNLAQALDEVEGVDIRQGTGKTGGLDISIRGLPSDYTLILIDGRRQNTAGNVTPNGFNETRTSFIPPMSAIERIEVIRGPMSTLYGSDAMGGVINIITKKVANEWGGSVSLDHTFQEDRDYGETSNASVYLNGPLVADKLGLALRGSMYKRDESDLTFDDDSTVSKRGAAPVEGRNYNAGARLTLTPNEDHEFAMDFETGRQTYQNDKCQLGTLDGKASRGSNAVDGCAKDDPDNISGYKDELRFERDQFALTHTARLGFGTLDNSLTYSKTETLGRTIPGTRGLAYDAPYQSIVGGDDRELESKDLIFDSKLNAPIGDYHMLTVGGQYWDAQVTDGIAGEDFKQKSWALFAEDEWRLRDDLALTLGARYEDHEAFGGHVSPRAYLVWNTTDSWTIKGGVSRGYKTPSLNQLHDGISSVGGQGSTISFGNPDLDPETSTSTEIGFYYDNLSNFNANATLFHTKFKDKIESGPASPNCFFADAPNQPNCVSYGPGFQQENFSEDINLGKAKTQGVELGASWTFAPSWTLSGNYTYTDSEQLSGDDKGAPLTNTPMHMAFARLNWQATDDITLWFKGEYRGERSRFTQRSRNLTGDSLLVSNEVGDLEAYEVFHLGGSLRATDNLTFNATIYNLFDKDFTTGTYYDNGQSWASDYAQIGRATDGTIEEGRRLWLSANLTF
ncbi:TonB-dependent receptor domain-containing protein [Pseudomonas sp. 5P_3.1_Bac2]|uniref:TonB-dependent receptor domain-containing protein n=1 Tax=Pseudomonas sp. 5P_3.1_Bac2 TaxID=2971617 RepID=UPI0021CA160B|nr:TonB-dependent receptor [Pseudomonas sp. 5P_3.1_Bac2]MCU1718096.1 TonB-dependent receptor [Pseudomonas sp. 5P_3.1_Bac2]